MHTRATKASGRAIILLATTLLTLGACERSAPTGPVARDTHAESSSAHAWTRVDLERLDDAQAARLARAIEARDALASTLKGELMRAMQENGPVHAIEVCHTRAPQIAQEVAERYGLQIGRTARKRRNPGNTGPDWMRGVVERGVAEQVGFVDEHGALGVATPILLENACVVCHGSAEQVPPAVRQAIAERYPEDQATGFAPGDLRGWFWIQIPPEG